MTQLNMFSILLRTNLISSLSRRYISRSTVKRMSDPLMYDLFNTLQQQKVSNLMKEFADELINMRGKCIDIGCGSGNITEHILLPAVDTNAVITGVDISESMIEYAKERYTVKNRLEFEVLDIQTKRLPTKYVSEFDHVFSFHVLHWCQDIRQAFENIHRMLRPNGTMLVNFPLSHDAFGILKNMIQDIRFAPYIPDANKYIFPYHNSVNPHKELKKLLQNIGFTVMHCSIRDVYFLNENSNECATSIISILDFVDKIPCDLRKEFKKDFIHQFEEKKIICKQGKSQKTMMILDVYDQLIVFAEKGAI